MEELLENLLKFEEMLNKHAVSKGDIPQDYLKFFSQDTQTIELQLTKWFR